MEKNIPPGHELVQTEDGSVTAYSKRFGEACHSMTGAVNETWTHYIQGCQIQQRQIPDLKILEVGFGVGIGFFESLNALSGRHFHFVSMEIDEELVQWVIQNNETLKGMHKNSQGHYELQTDQFHLLILIGDARQTVPQQLTGMKFHAIYQDAFSPKRNPWLWTREWFELLRSLASDDCLMSTYSSSSSIRKAMIAAGWNVHKGVSFGPKRSSTRASLQGPTDEEILETLSRSLAPLLTDELAPHYQLNQSKDEHEKDQNN